MLIRSKFHNMPAWKTSHNAASYPNNPAATRNYNKKSAPKSAFKSVYKET
jgi:hypothetical protein